MLASLLKSMVAIRASVEIVRAFICLRNMVASHQDLSAKLAELEKRLNSHDGQIRNLFDTIRGFTDPDEEPPKMIGFHP